MPSNKRKKPKDTAVEGQEYCPRWHRVGRIGPDGDCTPVTCGGGNPGRAPKAKPSTALTLTTSPTLENGIDPADIERLKARHAFLQVPENLEGEAASKFVNKRLASLAPAALAEVEYRMKLGDSDERYGAALEVLDRSGFGKTDKSGAPTSPIIVINAGAGFKPPWAEKAEVIDAEVIDGGAIP